MQKFSIEHESSKQNFNRYEKVLHSVHGGSHSGCMRK